MNVVDVDVQALARRVVAGQDVADLLPASTATYVLARALLRAQGERDALAAVCEYLQEQLRQRGMRWAR